MFGWGRSCYRNRKGIMMSKEFLLPFSLLSRGGEELFLPLWLRSINACAAVQSTTAIKKKGKKYCHSRNASPWKKKSNNSKQPDTVLFTRHIYILKAVFINIWFQVCACTFLEQSQMCAGSCTSVFINRKEERHSQTATATKKGMKSIWMNCKHFTSVHQQKMELSQACVHP